MRSTPPDPKLFLTRAIRPRQGPARRDEERQATPTMTRVMSPVELKRLLPTLIELLRETVNGGASLGFLPPLGLEEAREYWLSLRPELEVGSRLLILARTGSGIVGSGQLAMATLPSSRHRAEVQKLFVSTGQRGLGVGRALMAAIHEAAQQHGRTLLLLNTRCGNPAEGFYRGLGYREVGVLPGWTVGPDGERYDHVALYRELAP